MKPGEGIVFDNVALWLSSRNRAYAKYSNLLSTHAIETDPTWPDSFIDFLHFKHNQSWTILYRHGLEATLDPKRLKELLIFVQDEAIPVEERVRRCLEGDHKCTGIANNIVTALLHTFHPDKYGVWNSVTERPLKLIKRKPTLPSDKGKAYIRINHALRDLASELNNDLTTIDCFMWYLLQ